VPRRAASNSQLGPYDAHTRRRFTSAPRRGWRPFRVSRIFLRRAQLQSSRLRVFCAGALNECDESCWLWIRDRHSLQDAVAARPRLTCRRSTRWCSGRDADDDQSTARLGRRLRHDFVDLEQAMLRHARALPATGRHNRAGTRSCDRVGRGRPDANEFHPFRHAHRCALFRRTKCNQRNDFRYRNRRASESRHASPKGIGGITAVSRRGRLRRRHPPLPTERNSRRLTARHHFPFDAARSDFREHKLAMPFASATARVNVAEINGR